MKKTGFLITLALTLTLILAACTTEDPHNQGRELTVSVTASNRTPAPGETITLEAHFEGPQNNDATAQWSVAPQGGTFSTTTGNTTTWTAPTEAGNHLITATADLDNKTTGSALINVAHKAISHTVPVNHDGSFTLELPSPDNPTGGSVTTVNGLIAAGAYDTVTFANKPAAAAEVASAGVAGFVPAACVNDWFSSKDWVTHVYADGPRGRECMIIERGEEHDPGKTMIIHGWYYSPQQQSIQDNNWELPTNTGAGHLNLRADADLKLGAGWNLTTATFNEQNLSVTIVNAELEEPLVFVPQEQ